MQLGAKFVCALIALSSGCALAHGPTGTSERRDSPHVPSAAVAIGGGAAPAPGDVNAAAVAAVTTGGATRPQAQAAGSIDASGVSASAAAWLVEFRELVELDCVETLVCMRGGDVDRCVVASALALGKASAQARAAFVASVQRCRGNRDCVYVDCTQH